MSPTPIHLLYVAAGGAAGSLLRYAAVRLGQSWIEGPFPAGTLLVNASGCVLIGVLGALLAAPHVGSSPLAEPLHLLFGVGFLGAFTTFSAFGFETLHLLQQDRIALAVANVLANNGLGLLGVWAGYRAGAAWSG